MKITKVETFLVKPRWLFLKLHTDEGHAGLGEPIVEGHALTVATAVAELAPYLAGQDPTRVMHHWQAMYRHAFYRGGPVLTSALSGVEHALWDLAGKAAGLQLDASIPNFLAQEHTTFGAGYLKQPLVFKDGYPDLPTAPGLGIELDDDALAGKIGHDWRNPETYHPDDGAAIDW